MSILTRLRGKFFGPSLPDLPGPGVHHYQRGGGMEKTRLHLRFEEDGKGLLLVNANRAFHLNPSAAFMAYLSLEGTEDEAALRAITANFHVKKEQAQRDYADLKSQLEVIAQPGEHCAICELDLETSAPFSERPSAPYRMDLALTYRCNNNCAHCYNARSRQHPELSTLDWKLILERVWEVGIPHVVFTGGEPTLREDLPELIAYAEELGMISGINTNGRRLKDPAFVESLVKAGLDHVQITLESHNPTIHNHMVKNNQAFEETVAGIQTALAAPLYVMTNTTLLTYNAPFLEDTLNYLAKLGVPTVGLNALIYSGRGLEVNAGLPERDLPHLLALARELTDYFGQRLIWYTPTQYCHFDPVQMELGVKGCTAALYNMCVEPDGNVLPCQSYYKPLGNLLSDPWESIWNHPLAVSLREHHNLPTECTTCALLSECGGGCPLEREAKHESNPVHR